MSHWLNQSIQLCVLSLQQKKYRRQKKRFILGLDSCVLTLIFRHGMLEMQCRLSTINRCPISTFQIGSLWKTDWMINVVKCLFK